MNYSEEEIEQKFKIIIDEIESGTPLYKALKKHGPQTSTWYRWVDSSPEKAQEYARACQVRANKIFEDILIISDATADDIIIDPDTGQQIVNHNVIARDKLRTDNRKWMLSKMFPKKYGDKLELYGDPENPINSKVTVEIIKSNVDPAASEDQVSV